MISLSKKKKLWKSNVRWPPGPRGWPLLGCIPFLGACPHRNLADLAKNCYDENPVLWRQGHWLRQVRGCVAKIFLMELFTAKRFSSFQVTRKQEIIRGINGAIEICCGGAKCVRMDLILGKLAMNIVTRMLLNEGKLSDEANAMKDTDDFQQTLKEVMTLAGSFYTGDFIPWWDKFDPQGFKKQMHAVFRKYDTFMQRILDDHKMKLEAAQGTRDDIVYALLTRPSDVDGHYLSEAEMKGIILDVILGGTDTNSSTIEWALSELLKQPHILEKAQAEMDSVVGKERLVEESDLPNLPYLHAIVEETFRLHPVAPLLMHSSMEDCEIQGYRIPANTRLFVNVYAIHRDPEVYDRPSEFYPDRFLHRKLDVHGKDFALMPFGSGRRICPGRGLGLLLVQYILALLLQTCNLSLPAGVKPQELDMEEKFGLIVPRRNALKAVLLPRVPKHLLVDHVSF
ncbi:hypothetical protein R1sor_004815 [Riccia sorocarpa]|uniref:Cytochrome P450 n=1 Tax=Riccia sorocarpa TaxID=122646 RepID=A0ABD3HLN8_9MARC